MDTTMTIATPRPKMTRGRAIFLKVMDFYRGLGYDLSMLVVQKLAYFLQISGLDLKLHYKKQKFGPYAEEVNYVLQRMEGHYIRGYGDRSQRAQISPLPSALQAADDFLAADPEARRLLERVQQLIEGFETPYGMELLATVHWVAVEHPENALDLNQITQAIQNWNARKKQRYQPDHIRVAWERLNHQHWLPG